MPKKERDYVWKYVPVHMQDKGGYDEGYYYNYCHDCWKRGTKPDEQLSSSEKILAAVGEKHAELEPNTSGEAESGSS